MHSDPQAAAAPVTLAQPQMARARRDAAHHPALGALALALLATACSAPPPGREAPGPVAQGSTHAHAAAAAPAAAPAKAAESADAAAQRPAPAAGPATLPPGRTVAPKPLDGRPMAQDIARKALGTNATPPLAMAFAPGLAAPASPEVRVGTRHTPAHGVVQVAREPVSTFSVDVDTGSYSSVRGLLQRGAAVPADAVRVEEMVNYFAYAYPRPEQARSAAPFAVATELTASPWNPGRHLLRIGVQATDPAKDSLPPANLVFLVDVSGSMHVPQSLPLVKEALAAFTDQLREEDHVSIVTYASGTQVLLESVSGARKDLIRAAIASLKAGGSTAGASGIRLAYDQARRGFVQGGINRILLATDGDFNVGVTDIDQLKSMVAAERRSGIGLSTLGVGAASYNDALMEQIADAGDGKYSFLDSPAEARRVLVDEFTSTLATVARDVKVQLEFNPAVVSEYRLVGYDNRALRREDFGNDRVDAGDIGAGHRVTALYEISLAGGPVAHEPGRYGAHRRPAPAAAAGPHAGELGFLRLRYKRPDADRSELIETPIAAAALPWAQASADTRFAAAVAGWAQWLQGSPHIGGYGPQEVAALAEGSLGADPQGQRRAFVELVRRSAAGRGGEAALIGRAER